MLKLKLFIFVMLASFAAAGISFCQSDPEKPKIESIAARVTKIDWIGSNIVVKVLQSQPVFRYSEKAFKVSSDTKITKGEESISLQDINVGSAATIEYYEDSPGSLKAVSIYIEEQIVEGPMDIGR